MKSKFIFLFLLLLNLTHKVTANEIYFESGEINISNNGNIIESSKGIAKSADGDMTISANRFYYDKSSSILIASGDSVAFFKDKNISINSDKFIYNKNLQNLDSIGNVIINHLSKNVILKSNKIFYDIEKEKISSETKSTINDSMENLFIAENFILTLNNNLIKLNKVKVTDFQKNILEIDKAYINLRSNKLIGKDVSIDFNEQYFQKNNEPRLKGTTVSSDFDNTVVKNGIFTTCKKRDDCPPWQFSAKEIKHDKKNQIISYKNAWLKLYDKPVFYFPKFFHPDPTVKRKSGFLMPSFQSSASIGSSLNTPYFYAISDNKDMTFQPRFYADEKILLQSEYREINQSSSHILDFSLLSEANQNSKNHFFSNTTKSLDFENFDETNLDFELQRVSDDVYLKSHKLKSPVIKDTSYLTSSLGLSGYREDFSFDTNLYVYETLSKKKSDRYEFIYPSYNLSKTLNPFASLEGDFLLNSSGFMKNYNTNIFEKVVVNDLIFNSIPKFTSNGIKNDYKFLIKNINTDATNSKKYRSKRDSKLASIFDYSISYPLKKSDNKYVNFLKPMMSFKLSPSRSYGLKESSNKINIDNAFSLNRIMNNTTIEEGASLTYGTEFTKTNKVNKRAFSAKIANIFRLDESENLPKNNQLGEKTSNIFGSFDYDANENFRASYDYALDSNLADTRFQSLSTEFKINNFVTSFEYLNENNISGNSSFLSNKTSYNIDDTKNLTFETRKNKETSATEFYNLMYQYRNDCLIAGIEYNKDYYTDEGLKPDENIFFKLTIIPFGETKSPNLK